MLPEVHTWFEQRTFSADQFPAEQVARAKNGRRVSVVLPARDEESTVGHIVESLRTALMDQVALIDEIVVIDSDSTDQTAQRALQAGARVYRQHEILPHLDHRAGKGEALWKSLAVTGGDIVVFIDADLRHFNPNFVTGLVGPLVTTPSVHFTKGCFDRPLDDGRTVLPAGGGRVTELVARPLLNAWWPQLAGFVQPLGGEYAGTRELLESVPFASGYGVDIGLLIDVEARMGLSAMAQVDLGVRYHRNSSDESLVRMAARIHQTVHDRLVAQGRTTTTESPAQNVTTFHRSAGRGHYVPTTSHIFGADRPPMTNVREVVAAQSNTPPDMGER